MNKYSKDPKFFVTEKVSINPTSIIKYKQIDWVDNPIKINSNSLKNLIDNKHKLTVSFKAQAKLQKSITYLLAGAKEKKVYNSKYNSYFKFKVSFLTLTLPSRQIHTDMEITSACLNQFFTELRSKYDLTHYVWRAEMQGNRNIHYHILSDRWLPYKEINVIWNRIIEKLGYVSAFEKVHKKRNPNTTDIHSLKKIKNVSQYIMKYMSKTDTSDRVKYKRKVVDGIKKFKKGTSSLSNNVKEYLRMELSASRVWGCSQSLSNLKGSVQEIDNDINEELKRIESDTTVWKFNKDFVSCMYFDSEYLIRNNYTCLYSYLLKYLDLLDFREQSLDHITEYPPPDYR
jgi:hypothetical protein